MTHHEKAQDFLAELTEKQPQLPFEPSLLADLFASTGDEAVATNEQVATLVGRSQNLAARVLQLANSAYYGFGAAVSSLPQAVRILGLNEIRAMVIGLGAAAAFKKSDVPTGFELAQTWTHQVLTASLARELGILARQHAPSMHAIAPEELYAAGLLHDIGKILIASRRPQDWLAIAEYAAAASLPFHLAEDAYWGIDHSVVGARLLFYWQLPSRLTEPVSWHHAPTLAETEYSDASRLLAAANCLANAIAASGMAPVIPEEARAYLPGDITDEILTPSLERLLARDGSATLAAALLA